MTTSHTSEWKCPCGLSNQASWTQGDGLDVESMRHIRMHHANSMNWKSVHRLKPFCKVDYCQYCGDQWKSVLYGLNIEEGRYQCDICFHFGVRLMPWQPGYENSMGDLIGKMKITNRLLREASTPDKKPKQDQSLQSPCKESDAKRARKGACEIK